MSSAPILNSVHWVPSLHDTGVWVMQCAQNMSLLYRTAECTMLCSKPLCSEFFDRDTGIVKGCCELLVLSEMEYWKFTQSRAKQLSSKEAKLKVANLQPVQLLAIGCGICTHAFTTEVAAAPKAADSTAVTKTFISLGKPRMSTSRSWLRIVL